MKEKKALSLDELDQISGGYMGFTSGDCPQGGMHDWVVTGIERPATKCNERYAATHPDKQIQCSKCNKIGWKVFTNDVRWVFTYDD